VGECAVVGASDEQRGEQVVAFVVARAGSAPPSVEDLRGHCRRELAGYKVPRRFLVVGELPKGPTGKADRKVLMRMAAERAR
jgi:acyl-CoA synthetase (AMP-forming)/AMP-acid ligase II